MSTLPFLTQHYSSGASPQQCPHDFPNSFDYGKRCCHYDKDLGEIALSSRSTSCYRNAEMRCAQDRCVDNRKYLAIF